ncbi:MAG TPA: DUF748 domain-containing protein, partial [Syntrophorhabdaceae bacterium]|nr:DUF748 domain-containing protein [Syntrophorhabdaceae bacterium]
QASLRWREILTGHIVGDISIYKPVFHVNLTQFRTEEKSTVPINKKGWQQAVESIYPLKINSFNVHDGDITYIDEGPYKPLKIDHIEINAYNIKNMRYRQNVYPSSFHCEGRIFGRGKVLMNGYANFLLEPHLGVRANVDLSDMDISYFRPILNRANVDIRKGTLGARGNIEYNPQKLDVNMDEVDIHAADLDYIHLPQTALKEKTRAKKAVRAAKEYSNEPSTKIRIKELRIESSSLAYVDKTKDPNYRLYINQLQGRLKTFSNQFAEGPSTLELTGRFMGTGAARVSATFRPETKSPDFNINVVIENTNMLPMTDLFRAYGKFDIQSGWFSFYSELTVKNNTVNGYVKPLFRDLKVTDSRSDEEKSAFRKLYTGLIGGLSKLLENRPRKEIATKADISGPLESPGTSTWQVILNLLRNAFIRAILPGFEKEAA